ncbi:hypothetical protein RirG_195390 [Rhizophagus irregularis DAOM 197198w]|uniref:Uncharacterized protein n=1 Tax=Rhizophagus irregularis (strain DAOM 197198w) TaxID=1432141 RepID=A0A015IWM4_RHIIW|nr:hypothetical protein RirG_195390 [Rhizophagus irregularis DAOM 197198w]
MREFIIGCIIKCSKLQPTFSKSVIKDCESSISFNSKVLILHFALINGRKVLILQLLAPMNLNFSNFVQLSRPSNDTLRKSIYSNSSDVKVSDFFANIAIAEVTLLPEDLNLTFDNSVCDFIKSAKV